MATTPPLDYYGMYLAHNSQFLAFSAAMEGRKAETMEAARKARAVISDSLLEAMPGLDWYLAEVYLGMVRFGMWDEILAEPALNEKLAGLVSGRLYARVVALAAKGRVAEAAAELAMLEKLAGSAGPDQAAGLNTLADVLVVAVLAAKGRLAAAQGHSDEAAALLRQAAAAEDKLAYDEPADWFIPARHMLGAVLLKAGHAAEAEAAYRDDLQRNPENGWALHGLAQALNAQGRAADAAAAQNRFAAAWRNADVTTLTTSVY
jgi:tetratricopeptide (TPR) repeat protein